MSKVPHDLRFLKSHEWARLETDGTVTVGISDHAQQALGDLVFVETPDAGRRVAAGEVTAGNPQLTSQPDLINRDPYGEGWILRLKPSGSGGAAETLDAAAYEAAIAAGG